MPRQQPRVRLADAADAERVDEARQRNAPPRLDRARQVARPRSRPSLRVPRSPPRARAALKMSAGPCSQPGGIEFADRLLAQPVDIEGGARDEMDQPLHALRGADQRRRCSAAPPRPAGAPRGCRRPGRCRGTRRAARVRRPALQHDRDDLRDHVAGALQHHGVADADVLAGDLVLVVQRGVLHQHAADIHRLPARATGVSAPVRPTWIWMSRSTVVACSAGNFQAIAQRGARPTKPSRRCNARSSIL